MSARLVLLSALLLVVAAAPASAGNFASAYTKHEYAKCAERPSPEPGVVEVRACEGFAGILVIWTGEPDASTVDFGTVAKSEPLGLGSFHEPENTVEWRGPTSGGRLVPAAAILRYATGPSVGKLNVSRLVVYRVAPKQPSCVMAIVSGRDANEKARALVDRHASGFVCGKSPRLAE